MTKEERVREAGHRIFESVVGDDSQTVRCTCGRSATFARAKAMGYGGAMDREPARSLAEFVCLKDSIVIRAHALRVVE